MLRLALATLLLVGPPTDGDSAPTPTPTVVGMEFGTAIPKRERAAMREQFDRALPVACEPPPCTGECSPDQPRVGVRIDGSSRDYTLIWVGEDPRLSEAITITSRCELCGLAELETQLAADLRSLCERMQAIEGAPGRARISADPANAWVWIDGRRRGRTPWAGELEPGAHQLEVRARGYGRQTRALQVFGGFEEHEHFELMATHTRARPSWPGWLSLGLGVALGVAGTALIALDGKEWAARCTGANVDELGNCRYLYATQSLGIALAAGGAATFMASVGLLVWSQQEQRGAGVAWRGTF